VKVSLIVATLGERPDGIRRLTDSVRAGVHQGVELIIVHQSRGERPASSGFPSAEAMRLVHVQADPGLSRARNRGLALASGAIVGFPDDDCWYPPELLAEVVTRFEANPSLSALAGRPTDTSGRSSFPRWDVSPGWVNRFNVWRRVNSNALFLRRTVTDVVGGFDETLGLGSGTAWGSAEDVDYPLRVLEAGFSIYYDPALQVYHPAVQPAYDTGGRRRAESYGGGMGRVLRKHRYPSWFALYSGARPLAGACLSLLAGKLDKAHYHYAIFRGRYKGWMT
jgi:GT2 family glycosyltransferase